jgi:YVTN family beta-propeller protein
MLLSCEFASSMIVVDVGRERVIKTVPLRPQASPQDVKLAPDGSVFYVADLVYGGVWVISAKGFQVTGFVKTGAGAHGLYPSRDGRFLYVSDRSAGAVSVLSFRTRKVVKTWLIPGGSPDMGNVSADGRVLWLSGRYDNQVYAIDTRTGKLLARVPVGAGPHGVCVWPQPGRYSLGHTGIMR